MRTRMVARSAMFTVRDLAGGLIVGVALGAAIDGAGKAVPALARGLAIVVAGSVLIMSARMWGRDVAAVGRPVRRNRVELRVTDACGLRLHPGARAPNALIPATIEKRHMRRPTYAQILRARPRWARLLAAALALTSAGATGCRT